MKKIIAGIVLLIVLVILHQYLLYCGKEIARDTLRDSGDYPAQIESLQGFLPFGKIWLSGVQFKTRVNAGSIDWSIPSGTMNVKMFPLVSKKLFFQGMSFPIVNWTAVFPDNNISVKGDLSIEGSPGQSPTMDLPAGSFWGGNVKLNMNLAQLVWKDKPALALHKTELILNPLNFHQDAPFHPMDFDLTTHLSPSENRSKIHAQGNLKPKEKQIDANIRLDAMQVTDLMPISEMAKLNISRWIRGGSITVNLDTQATPNLANGQVTLRLHKVKFGDELRSMKVGSQSAEAVLNALESRPETVQIGPLKFTEDLTTERVESWGQITQQFAMEILRIAPDAAIEAGRNLIRGLLDR